MGEILFLTGASGVVGQALLRECLAKPQVDRVFALQHDAGIDASDPRVIALRGDITRPELGLDAREAARLAGDVTVILHAAAATRFDTPPDVARRVNVEGVRGVLAFGARCVRRPRVACLSTTHVAGRRTGLVLESELEHDCGFINEYEQSKYEAERLIRDDMGALPLVVCRLSTIAGDSVTGAVARPVAFHQALRFVFHSLAPMVPGTPESPVDLIALDYAAKAIVYLTIDRFHAGSTYHLCAAEDALSLDALLKMTIDTFLDHRPEWRKRAIAPPAIVDLATFELFARSVEEIGDATLLQAIRVIRPFAPQLAYPKQFDDRVCRRGLEGSGIERPPLAEVFPRVLRHLVDTRWGTRDRDAERISA